MATQEIQDFVARLATAMSEAGDAHDEGTCDIDCYYCDCGL